MTAAILTTLGLLLATFVTLDFLWAKPRKGRGHLPRRAIVMSQRADGSMGYASFDLEERAQAKAAEAQRMAARTSTLPGGIVLRPVRL